MKMLLNPYVNFNGNAREAMEFYHSVFGGKLNLSTFGESMPTGDAAMDKKIMHAMLVAEDGLTLMGSDMPPGVPYEPGKNVGLSLSGEDEATLRGYFDKLAAGGTVAVPLDKAPWGDIFGMFTDKYGTHWLVNVNAERA